MNGPQLRGPIHPRIYSSGAAPSGLFTCVPAPSTRTLSVVTFIAVFYNGTGSGSPLIDFELTGEAAFWGSGPASGSIHTEQFPCWIPLDELQSMTCSASAPDQWSLFVAGFDCNNPTSS